MSKIFLIIKDSTVINRIIANSMSDFNYQRPHDSIIEDTTDSIHIGMATDDGINFYWPTFGNEE